MEYSRPYTLRNVSSIITKRVGRDLEVDGYNASPVRIRTMRTPSITRMTIAQMGNDFPPPLLLVPEMGDAVVGALLAEVTTLPVLSSVC